MRWTVAEFFVHGAFLHHTWYMVASCLTARMGSLAQTKVFTATGELDNMARSTSAVDPSPGPILSPVSELLGMTLTGPNLQSIKGETI